MELNAHKFSLAAAIVMGVTYAVCGIFTMLAPDIALKFLGWMLHLVNVEKFAGGVEVTFGAFILGALPLLFYAYFGTFLFAWLYNKFLHTGQ